MFELDRRTLFVPKREAHGVHNTGWTSTFKLPRLPIRSWKVISTSNVTAGVVVAGGVLETIDDIDLEGDGLPLFQVRDGHLPATALMTGVIMERQSWNTTDGYVNGFIANGVPVVATPERGYFKINQKIDLSYFRDVQLTIVHDAATAVWAGALGYTIEERLCYEYDPLCKDMLHIYNWFDDADVVVNHSIEIPNYMSVEGAYFSTSVAAAAVDRLTLFDENQVKLYSLNGLDECGIGADLLAEAQGFGWPLMGWGFAENLYPGIYSESAPNRVLEIHWEAANPAEIGIGLFYGTLNPAYLQVIQAAHVSES